jgi:hypothetical protein
MIIILLIAVGLLVFLYIDRYSSVEAPEVSCLHHGGCEILEDGTVIVQ